MIKRFGIPILLILSVFSLTLSGCSKRETVQDGPPTQTSMNLHKIPDAVPKVEPIKKRGNRFGKGGKSNTYVAKKKRYQVLSSSRGYKARGIASWYGARFHRRPTSSGEPYNMYAMTAAHPTLPLPTYAKVTNLDNGQSVIVKINDRGPFRKNRLIDLSYTAATKLGIVKRGTGRVEVVSIDPRDHGGKIPKASNILPTTTTALASNAKSTAIPLQKIYLQIGNFNDRNNAEAMVKKIGTLSSMPTNITQRGNSKYQIRIGPVQNRLEAIKLTQRLAQEKLPPPVVISLKP